MPWCPNHFTPRWLLVFLLVSLFHPPIIASVLLPPSSSLHPYYYPPSPRFHSNGITHSRAVARRDAEITIATSSTFLFSSFFFHLIPFILFSLLPQLIPFSFLLASSPLLLPSRTSHTHTHTHTPFLSYSSSSPFPCQWTDFPFIRVQQIRRYCILARQAKPLSVLDI